MDKLKLLKLLRAIEPTGEEGFEGLVKSLLEALTGTLFDLAKSGYQQGSDMATRISFPKMVVECKRYGSTELNDRELLGEIAEAQQGNPNLDVWALGVTKKINSVLLTKLQVEASRRAIGLVVIDEDEDVLEIGRLIHLCCEFNSITKRFIEDNKLAKSFEKFANTVCSQSSHISMVNNLRTEISDAIKGLDTKLICDSLICRFDETSKNNFINQDIRPKAAIQRNNLNKGLTRWLNGNSEEVAVITGEEGLGKTWGVAKWVYELVNEKEIPVLFATSSFIADMTEPEDVLANLLKIFTPTKTRRSVEFWKRKISYWSMANNARVVVVLDGINEWSDVTNAGKLIQKWNEDGFTKFAHLIVTCREYQWQTILCKYIEKSHGIIVNKLSDPELNQLLDTHGLSIEELPGNIHDLLRRPRYFHLAIELKEKLEVFRDITPAHLIYFDLEHKYEQNLITSKCLGLSDHKDFSSLLKSIVEKTSPQDTLGFNPIVSGDILRGSLREYVSDNWQRTRSEMLSMDILREADEGYILNDRYLVNFIGKIIHDLIKNTDNHSESEFENYFAQLFEPYSGFDLKEECLAHAVFWAVIDKNKKDNTIRRLLGKWIFSQQFVRWEEIAAFIPAIQNAVFGIIDSKELFPFSVDRGFKWLLSIIAEHSEDDPDDSLVKKINEWLSTAPAKPSFRESDDPMIVNGEVGSIGTYQYTLKTSHITQVSSFALSVLSSKPFESCVKGLIAHAILQESDHRPGSKDLFQWVVSTSYQQILKKEIPIRLNSLKNSTIEKDIYTIIGLLNLAFYLGESNIGKTISMLPDFVGEHDIRLKKYWASSTCWSEETATVCRNYALSEQCDSFLSQNARKTCMEMQDDKIIDEIVKQVKINDHRIYDFDIHSIWESRHNEWISNYLEQVDLNTTVMTRNSFVIFPFTLRPSDYAMKCISGFLSDKNPDVIFHTIFKIHKAYWGNKELGVLSESFISNEIEQCLSVLRKGKIHEYRGYTILDSNWETISPLLYHNAPALAADFIRFQIGQLKQHKNPEVFTRILSEGAATVSSENEYRILNEIYNKSLERIVEKDDAGRTYVLKSLIMSSPDVTTAQSILINAPYSVMRWTGLNPVRLMAADDSLFSAIIEKIKHSNSESLMGYMWMVFHTGYFDKQKACEIAYKYFLESTDENIKYVTSAILGRYGEEKEAEFLWYNIESVTKIIGGKQRYPEIVFWDYNIFLKNISIDELLKFLGLELVNYLIFTWDDESKADEFANIIENHIEKINNKSRKSFSEVLVPYYTSNGLEYLWKYRQDSIRKWIDKALDAKQYDSFTMSSFYWEIATFLIKVEPETSIQIAETMSPFSNNGKWKTAICSQDVPECIKSYREKCILNSNNNAEIFDWALSFRNAENEDWAWAIEHLKDDKPLKRAIAVQLLGWSGSDCEKIIYELAYDDSNDYVRHCAIKANEDWWREHWAYKWYMELFTAKTIEETWAAQELFKLVADKRATIWFDPTTEMMGNLDWKQKGIIYNTQWNLNEYGKKYVDAQKDSFFGQRIKHFKDVVETFVVS